MRMGFRDSLLAVVVFGFGGVSWAATDDFDDDPLDDPAWELYEPVPGAAYSVEDGWCAQRGVIGIGAAEDRS